MCISCSYCLRAHVDKNLSEEIGGGQVQALSLFARLHGVIVDRVLRYENLAAELSNVFSQLKIPFDGTLGIQAKSEYSTDRRPYQRVFNNGQRRIIENAFAREIELHGYRFEARYPD